MNQKPRVVIDIEDLKDVTSADKKADKQPKAAGGLATVGAPIGGVGSTLPVTYSTVMCPW
jgi:hypothetical protein